MSDAYVYVYRDAAGAPRYVGKGRGNRVNDHISLANAHNEGRRLERATRFTRWLAKCIREGRGFNHEVVARGLTDEDAFALEIKLIATFKRMREGGTLYNTQDGGDGFTSAEAKRIANDPDVKRRKADSVRKAFSKPEVKARLRAATAESNGRPHRREQAREKALAEWANPDRRAAAARRAKELWADPAWSAARRKEIIERNKNGIKQK